MGNLPEYLVSFDVDDVTALTVFQQHLVAIQHEGIGVGLHVFPTQAVTLPVVHVPGGHHLVVQHPHVFRLGELTLQGLQCSCCLADFLPCLLTVLLSLCRCRAGQHAPCYYEQHTNPLDDRHLFMEDSDGCQHAEDIAQADHGIGRTEGKLSRDIHPQQRGQGEQHTTGSKVPVGDQTPPIGPSPGKGGHPSQGEFQKHLTAHEQNALHNNVWYYLPHDITIALE